MMNNVDIVVDLQFGSTGKGLFCGWLAKENEYDTVINANTPNAGHTFMDKDGRVLMNKVLPSGSVATSVRKIMIGPGSIFDPDRLIEEISNLNHYMGQNCWHKLKIHEDAIPLWPDDKAIEQGDPMLDAISSTQQGTAPAKMRKLSRGPGTKEANASIMKHKGLFPYILTNAQWVESIWESKRILIEGAQGYSLGIDAGFYPYCTSRNCTPAQFFADCAVPIQWLNTTYGVCRTFPIRVGGTSGPVYPDQIEKTWDEMGLPEERTTVTNKVRRVFTFSPMGHRQAVMACRPDVLFLNFCNYCEGEQLIHLADRMKQLGKGPDIYGYGPKETDIVTSPRRV